MTSSSIQNRTNRFLRIIFFVSFSILAIAFLLLLLNMFHFKEISHKLNLAVHQYTLILTIASIPLALKIFSILLNKNPKPRNESEAISRYKKAFYIRLCWLFFVSGANIALYAISYDKNYAWLTAILLIIFLFCTPSEREMKNIMLIETTDE